MRNAICILTALFLLAPASGFAQERMEYEDLEQRFRVNLPGEPTIEDTTIISQRGGASTRRAFTGPVTA